MIALVLMAAIFVGPASLRAVGWGHPEEILGAALAVSAVLAAIHGKSVAAGVLLGLAIANKQWGVFAVLPVLLVARENRRQVAMVAVIAGALFILPMLAGDPSRFLEQNLHTAVAQLGVEPTDIWWPFHHPGFDPTLHQPDNMIPTALREISHPLTVAVAFGLSLLYWARRRDAHPYDALQLLALLFLIRCVLDPQTISYHHLPFVVAVAMFEGLRRRGIPVVTLTSTAAILALANFRCCSTTQT